MRYTQPPRAQTDEHAHHRARMPDPPRTVPRAITLATVVLAAIVVVAVPTVVATLVTMALALVVTVGAGVAAVAVAFAAAHRVGTVTVPTWARPRAIANLRERTELAR